jgi:hypothetical protein
MRNELIIFIYYIPFVKNKKLFKPSMYNEKWGCYEKHSCLLHNSSTVFEQFVNLINDD